MTQAVKTYNATMRHAFTLIELLICVAVIVIIVGFGSALFSKRKVVDATPSAPVPTWKKDLVHADNQMATYVVTSPDGQQWVVFNGQGTTAMTYTPRPITKSVEQE